MRGSWQQLYLMSAVTVAGSLCLLFLERHLLACPHGEFFFSRGTEKNRWMSGAVEKDEENGRERRLIVDTKLQKTTP